MNGILKEIEIMDELILKVAKAQFNELNKEEFNNMNEYFVGTWCDYACHDLETFNEIVKIFKKIGFRCDVDE